MVKSCFCDEIRLKTEKIMSTNNPTTLFSSRYTNIIIYLEKIYLNHNLKVMFEPNLNCIELISRAQQL